MDRLLGLLVSLSLLTGCTAPVLQVPIGQAALVYADAKTLGAVMALRVGDLCSAGKLSADDCVYMDKQDALAKALDVDIRKGILEAKGEIDWNKVMQYLQILAGIAVKVGGF